MLQIKYLRDNMCDSLEVPTVHAYSVQSLDPSDEKKLII